MATNVTDVARGDTVATAIKASPAPANGIRYCVSCLAVYRQDFARCPLDGGTLTIGAADPWVGTRVGAHYVIDALVGQGAMGRVYRAHHRDLPDRKYAIKIMIGDYAATAQMRARFQAEAENASKLAHPNVVSVIDYGATDQGVNYIVMDLVEGPSLGEIVQKGPMDPDRVIRLARQMCEGLDHAHGRGMIHRDFKPDNILVVGEGDLEVARIADFGLALSIDTEVRLTTTGIVCTPAYAAPEQLRGDAIDLRVDLYALGTTLYEMLSGGQLPFNGDLDTSVRAKLLNDAPSVLHVAPNVPPSLVSIVGRLLSSEPSRRPRSANAVLRALDGALAAPRSIMKTDPTSPLRAITVKPVDPAVSRRMPTKATSKSPSEAPARQTRARTTARLGRRPLGRLLMQVFACGITIGGALAYVGLRGPDDVEPALHAIAEPAPARLFSEPGVAEAAPAPRTADPVSIVGEREDVPVDKPFDAEYTVRRLEPTQTIEKVEQLDVPPPEADAKHAPKADKVSKKALKKRPALPRADVGLQRQLSALATQLQQLDVWIGRENTDDLWDALRGVRIGRAMSAATREEASSTLSAIEAEIADRSPLR